MFINPNSKILSTLLRLNSSTIRSQLYDVFESSIVGCRGEIRFIRNLLRNLQGTLASLRIEGLFISSRFEEIHQKPIVTSPIGRCELGDLLVVIKYHCAPGVFEAKSIIYQVKLANGSSSSCSIDQTQMNLLCDWPVFSFGKLANGGPRNYHVSPTTLEFGSFMLEPRNPLPRAYMSGKYRCYGCCPNARLVRDIGPSTVNIRSIPYSRGDAQNFFSHLAFEIGEHHSNEAVKDLVDALYRHVGLSDDPPDEFSGYWKEFDDDGFAVLEINVKPEKMG